MSAECAAIHLLANKLVRHRFPFIDSSIPKNGIYIFFQESEVGHNLERIVRVGTHNKGGRLRSRLKEHFLREKKDRSIFRKNIGRAILNKRTDLFLETWNLDLTARKEKEKYASKIDLGRQREIEQEVSRYIRNKFSFVVFEVEDKEERLGIESKLISTISLCDECMPSTNWLGQFSPKQKIVESGLWLVNELYKTPFDASGIEHLEKVIGS